MSVVQTSCERERLIAVYEQQEVVLSSRRDMKGDVSSYSKGQTDQGISSSDQAIDGLFHVFEGSNRLLFWQSFPTVSAVLLISRPEMAASQEAAPQEMFQGSLAAGKTVWHRAESAAHACTLMSVRWMNS